MAKDADGQEIKLYRTDNPHVDGMLLGHVVKDNVVWVTDLSTPSKSMCNGVSIRGSLIAAVPEFVLARTSRLRMTCSQDSTDELQTGIDGRR